VVGICGALLLATAFAVRWREALRWGLLPWRLVVICLGLFLVVGFGQQHGLSRLLGDLAGHQDSFGGLLRTAASGAVGSNLVNNLPAYIALEPVAAASPDRLLSLLIGTNLGPLVTVWASLATLLWRERCRARGLQVRAGGFALAGLVGVPLLLVSTTAALWVTR
jgi:arsenical pump membrane protein